jgi:serine/threonine protein phosphatase 1
MADFIAIGDIHGMALALDTLLSRVPAAGTLVFLGDYIDRGPDSCAVIDRLLRLEAVRPCVFLRGNHEALALATVAGDPEAERTWHRNGGLQTLASYGGETFPAAHVEFLARTRLFLRTPDYLFVHAGLRPGCTPEAMEPEELYWIRAPFLESAYRWPELVIHGHTPLPSGRPDVRTNRINLDTGAVFGGALTAVLLPEVEFLHVP